jgi:tape measure domain-containing protein
VAKGDLELRVGVQADLGNFQSEAAKINSILASVSGAADAFKAKFEKDTKSESQYKIVVTSEYDESGTKIARAQVKELSKEYQGLYNKIRQVESEPQKGSLTSLRQQVNEAKKARDAIAKYGAAIDGIGSKIQALDGKWVTQNKRVQDLQKELNIAGASNIWQRLSAEYNLQGLVSAGRAISDFVNIFQSLSIVVGQVTGAINNVINSLAKLQEFSLAFEAIGAGSAGAAIALGESSKIALTLGSDLKIVRDTFQQLSPVILNTGGNINDVSNVVEALSSRFAAFGISGDRARRVTNGIIQAFAKGKLQAEEFTQQIAEADPAFGTDFAAALRISTAELAALIKAGEITSDVLLETLPKLGKVALFYGKLGTSAVDAANSIKKFNIPITVAQNKIQSLAQLSLESFARSLDPVIGVFIAIGAAIVDLVTNITKLESLKTITTILGGVAQSTGVAVSVFLALTKAALSVIEPIAALANAILAIPGAAQALGFAIVGNLAKSLSTVRQGFLQSSFAASGFGRVIAKATDFGAFSAGVKNLVSGSKGAQQELSKTSQSIRTLGNASQFAQGRIAVINREIGSLKTSLKNIAGKGINLPETNRLQNSITKLTQESERYERVLPRIQQNLLAASGRFSLLSGTVGAQAGLFGRLGAAAGAAGNAIAGGFRFAASAAGGFLSALGPIGVALAALAIVQAAYGTATKESRQEIEKTKTAVAAYGALVKDISGEEPEPPKLAGLERVWVTLSLTVADALDAARANLDNFSNIVAAWGDQVGDNINGVVENLKILPVFQGIFAVLGALFNNGSLESKLFARSFKETIDGIGQESTGIREATGALKALSATNDGTIESQARLSAKFKTTQAAVESSGERYDDAKIALDKFNKSLSGKPTEEQSAELKRLQDELIKAGVEATAARVDFEEFGISSGLAARAIEDSLTSIGGLNEKLKGLRANLEDAAAGSDAFKGFAVDIAATELRIESLQKLTKDPIELSIAIPGRTKEKLKELEILIEKQNKLLEESKNLDITINSKAFAVLQSEIDKVNVELSNLKLLDTKIKVTLQLLDQEFLAKIASLQADRALTDITLRTTVDQEQLRKVLTDLTAFRNDLNALFQEQQELKIKIADPTLGLEERRALAREELALAIQIENSIAKGAANLQESAASLVRQLTEARSALLNLKLGNIDLLPIEQQREAIRALNEQVQQISLSRGLKTVFEGTPEEILRSKIAFVNFYNELDKGENKVRDTEEALDLVTKIARRLKDSGLSGVFETIEESIRSLPTSTYRGAENANAMAGQLFRAAGQAEKIQKAITDLDGITVSVNVNYVGQPGLWTGGPTVGGQTYRINELGKEGFLSSTGDLSPINKPRNALWKAPGKGMVIPAHIMSTLDVPTGRVSTGVRPAVTGSSGNGLAKIARAIHAALSQTNKPDSGLQEMAAVQAHQSIQIGKLSRAVTKLADKDWNVNVGVRNTGSTAYLDALNRRM